MPEAEEETHVDRTSLVKYYSEVASEAKFNEPVGTWGYDKEFLEKCGFTEFDDLFVIACGGGCPLRLENQLPKKGDTVVDLGCGAGHDVTLAARIVGPTGRVIGVDITPAMLEKTQKNVDKHHKDTDAPVRLVQGIFDDGQNLPQLEAGCADMVISNGAFNLSANKKAAFAAAYRLLKPGGRFHLTDVCEDRDAVAAVEAGSCGGAPAACSARKKEDTSELPFQTPGGVTVEGWND